MILNIIFVVSGVMIFMLVSAKILEDKLKRKPLFLRLVSLGDERVKLWSEDFHHKYSEWKERAKFFVEKQLPLHTKSTLNKTTAMIKEKAEQYIGDIRGSKYLKKSDGISEFFKSLSEKENGGRIDGSLERPEDSQGESSKVEPRR